MPDVQAGDIFLYMILFRAKLKYDFVLLFIATLIAIASALNGCNSQSSDLYIRARAGAYVTAVPKFAADTKNSLSVSIYNDERLLKKIEIDSSSKKPFQLKLDEWPGEFLKISFESRRGAKWENIAEAESVNNDIFAPRRFTQGAPPNVVIYLVDALRADRLGCYNPQSTASPNIDLFSKEAVLFQRAYAPSSWTKSSVASLFTGTNPPAHGAIGREGMLDNKLPTLAESLKKAGYNTAAFITNGNVSETFAFDRGFDVFRFLPEDPAGEGVYGSSAELLDKTQSKIENIQEPFFIYMHQSDPHAPYTPPPETSRKFIPSDAAQISGSMDIIRKLIHRGMTISPPQLKYLAGLYDGEVAAADAGFGRFLDILRKRGAMQNTIVVFIADHGEEFYEHKGFAHGGTLYEESVRVPLIAKFPGDVTSKTLSAYACIVNIPGMILNYLGIEPPVTMSRGNAAPIYFHEELDKVVKEAILDWPMKLIRNVNLTNQWGDRTIQWEMYDLERDPSEINLIARERKITRQVLEAELKILREKNARSEPIPKINLSPEQKKKLEALGY